MIAAIPSSRNASGIQSLIPGLNVSQAGVAVGGGDSGGIAGGIGGLAGTIHGGNTYGSRTKTDGLNTDFTGQAIAGGQLLNTAGASEVVINTSGGLGEAEGAGVILNIIPKDGGNTFRGSAFVNGATGWMQGSNYTQSLKDQGLRTPSNLNSLYDCGCHGWRPDHPGQALVLRDLPPGRVEQHGPRHVGQQERQQSEPVGGGFRPVAAGVYGLRSTGTASGVSRGRRRRATS